VSTGLRACLHYPASAPGAGRILLVMLPGAGIEAEDFEAQGMVAAAQASAPGLDVIALRPELDLYLEDGIVPELHEAVIVPALAQGYRQIWLLGISLGGMGALLYASAHPGSLTGLVLLAPFLGTRGTMAELRMAGGFSAWREAASAATPPERRMLAWLQHRVQGQDRPLLYLGHGREDRFADGHRLLAAHLPPEQVALVAGGHDWPAWSAAWREILARRPFG
jgi:pimeloyl-ACP methyl ester carboxylesterase